MFASTGAQYIEKLARGNMSIRFIEVRHHTFQQAEGDDNVELCTLDPMDGGHRYAGPLAEHFLEK
ncbi:hypothetical protein D3C84_1215070 [compost metagenome]